MVIGILIFCSVFLFFLWFYMKEKERKDRFKSMFISPPAEKQASKIEQRTPLAIITRFFQRYFSILFPSENEMQEITKLLIRANIHRFTAEELFSLRHILAGILTVLFFLFFSSGANWLFATGMGLAGGYFGYIFPRIALKARAEGRQKRAKKELLDYIELLSTATEAGLTIHDAIRRVAEYSHGVLSEEFRRTWTDIHGGASRKEAFQGLSKRLDVEDITTFIDDILYSEKQGTPISQTMKRQAKRIRDKTRLLAVENAQNAAGKMIIPTIGLIFMPMIVLVLAPLAITLGKSFTY